MKVSDWLLVIALLLIVITLTLGGKLKTYDVAVFEILLLLVGFVMGIMVRK